MVFSSRVNWAGWSGASNFGANCEESFDTQGADLYGQYGCGDHTAACADGPERYRDAYRHVRAIFDAEGVSNAAWVWVANMTDFFFLEFSDTFTLEFVSCYLPCLTINDNFHSQWINKK